jgi:nucleoside triphosphate diphosphatase
MSKTPSAPPSHPATMDPRSIETLLAIMQALRTPATGCPWDLEQSFETIAPYTIEEAYEVADAIASGSREHLKEELGDLLLQPVYHAQMAAEEGAFSFADVVEGVVTKMIRRHPHVFSDEAARSAGVAKGFWEENKAKERAAKGEAHKRTLDGIPLALPGLTRAVKLQAKAAKVGFDWPHVSFVFDKLAEEIDELKEATLEKRSEELGDLLFVMANIARHYGIDPEASLRQANAKFERRFRYIEDQLETKKSSPKQSNLEEMDGLWNAAKKSGL